MKAQLFYKRRKVVMIELATKSIFINGEWREVTSNNTETIYNPATLEAITDIANGGMQETRDAIESARAAFPVWSEMSGRKRSRVLYKAAELMRKDADR